MAASIIVLHCLAPGFLFYHCISMKNYVRLAYIYLFTYGVLESKQTGDLGRIQFVQSGIHVPSIEPCLSRSFVFFRKNILVEDLVVRMRQFSFLYTLVVSDNAVSEKLNLRNVGKRRQISSDDGFLCSVLSSVTIRVDLGVKSFRHLVLRLWADVALVANYNDLVSIHCFFELFKVVIYIFPHL